MIQLRRNSFGPIGVDIGSRSVKLLQLTADGSRVVDAVRCDLASNEGNDVRERQAVIAAAIKKGRDGRAFRGRHAVLCLGSRELFVQNLRVPKTPGTEMQRLVEQEAAGKVPFPIGETDVRFIEAADVRQGDTIKREVILLACHRPVLEQLLTAAAAAG